MKGERTEEERIDAFDAYLERVREEGHRVIRMHGPYANPHHAYGVLVEEVAEFFDEVREKRELRSPLRMAKELIQVAQVATRFASELDPHRDRTPTEEG